MGAFFSHLDFLRINSEFIKHTLKQTNIASQNEFAYYLFAFYNNNSLCVAFTRSYPHSLSLLVILLAVSLFYTFLFSSSVCLFLPFYLISFNPPPFSSSHASPFPYISNFILVSFSFRHAWTHWIKLFHRVFVCGYFHFIWLEFSYVYWICMTQTTCFCK